MIAAERHERILEIVDASGSASLTDLAKALGTSDSTIRRDLSQLHQEGRLRRVRGGATRISPSEYITTDQSFAGRREMHMAEKRAIGAYAATLISPTDFVFVDAGTTTECLVDAITETRAIYLTNSLRHAQKLLAKGCRTILPGGEVKPMTEALVGAETVALIRRYHFSVGFWGTNGADLETGFTTPEFSEAAVKQIALEHTVRPYVLCDSSKFSQVSPITFAEFDRVQVITDRLADRSYVQAGNVIEVGSQA